MKTKHEVFFGNSKNMENLKSNSIDLMITSPPYPMIKMWDKQLSEQNPEINKALKEENGYLAFELMHKELDNVWKETYRVLKDGGFACINIGDATRKVNGSFRLYSNHSRILSYCSKLGFHILPVIIWRKQTNKPNKFMGSGMLPAGAYVTFEHEYILILRKGLKREFKTEEEKSNRRKSAYFWEERNNWFSDVWFDIKGDKQKLTDDRIRKRSGAYPFELSYRLINMFSAYGDIVLDPFLGTGTTIITAIASGRNSIGFEIDPNFEKIINEKIGFAVKISEQRINERLTTHNDFVKKRERDKGKLGYMNINHNFPIMTKQEQNLELLRPVSVNEIEKNVFEVEHLQTKTISDYPLINYYMSY